MKGAGLAILVLGCGLAGRPGTASPQDAVRIQVYRLFQTQEIEWSHRGPGSVRISAKDRTLHFPSTAGQTFRIRAVEGGFRLSAQDGAQTQGERFDGAICIDLRVGGLPGEFTLRIPTKIERRFRGILEIRRDQNAGLQTILTSDVESLTAGIVAAEMSGVQESAALQAQAVVARSFIRTARGRHRKEGFDFCDTTHCQYTRGADVSEIHSGAVTATRGLLVTYDGRILRTHYAAVCTGRLQPLSPEWAGRLSYPHREVVCASCSSRSSDPRHPEPIASPYSGATNGHSIGLCQAGAIFLARQGRNFREILAHFFPDTELIPLPR